MYTVTLTATGAESGSATFPVGLGKVLTQRVEKELKIDVTICEDPAACAPGADIDVTSCQGSTCNSKHFFVAKEDGDTHLLCIGKDGCNSVRFICEVPAQCRIFCFGGEPACNSVEYSRGIALECASKKACNSMSQIGGGEHPSWPSPPSTPPSPPSTPPSPSSPPSPPGGGEPAAPPSAPGDFAITEFDGIEEFDEDGSEVEKVVETLSKQGAKSLKEKTSLTGSPEVVKASVVADDDKGQSKNVEGAAEQEADSASTLPQATVIAIVGGAAAACLVAVAVALAVRHFRRGEEKKAAAFDVSITVNQVAGTPLP